MLIIQARMDSSRLPKKVMAEILGKPLIWYLVQRLRKIPSISMVIISTTKEKEDKSSISMVIISTTKEKEDKSLIEFAESEGIDPLKALSDKWFAQLDDAD